MIKEMEIIKILSEKGYRITESRKDVIKCLFDENHIHTIGEIVEHISKKNKHINVSSTYNTIEILLKEGFIDVCINYDTKSLSYEIINLKKQHIHVYNPNTKKNHVVNFSESLNKEIQDLVKSKLNLEVYNIKIDVFVKKT